MQVKKIARFFLVLFLVSMATSLAFALGEGNRNLLLIGVMGISPLIVLVNFRFDKSDLLLFAFLLSITIFPLYFHPETMRWSTVMYSYMFGFTFIAYKQLLRKGLFLPEDYLRILKFLILAYFVVLLIQQFCVLTGLPVFNLSNYQPEYPWKLNSLAAEPSHSARIVAVLMYSYIVVKEIISNKKYHFRDNLKEDRWVWIAFLWTMLTMGSATAFLFIAIVLFKFVRFRNIFPLAVLLVLIAILVNALGITAFERTYHTFMATLTLDPKAIIKADHSAAMRITPMLVSLEMVNLNTLEGLFGYGIDYTASYLSRLIPGLPEGATGGAMIQIWIEYGIFAFVTITIYSLINSFRKRDLLSVAFWFLLVFMYGVNNQIVWLAIILLFSNKHFTIRK